MASFDQAFIARTGSAFEAFINAETWTDTRAVLLDRTELLTAEAMRYVDGFVAFQEQEEQLAASTLEFLQEHQRILHAARLYGADVALAEKFLDHENPDPYWAACFGVAGLLGCDTWPEVRHWLTAYPSLLDPGTDGVITALTAAHHAAEPLPLQGVLAECQRFLASCRADGVDAALALAEQDEFLLVPLDFGTVTAAFFALATTKDDALAAQLIAGHPDLVGDAFDAELDHTIGGLITAGDSRFTGILVPVRFVLLRCQEVASAVARAEWRDLREPGQEDPVDAAIVQLSVAPGEPEVREILSRNPALLDQETDARIGKYLALMRANNHDADFERLTALRSALARYREAGPAGNEAALAAARDAARTADAAEEAAVAAAAGYPAALQEFIAAADWVTARGVLEAHPELLADDALGLLDAESTRHAGTARGYELGAYLQLFRQAAALGIGPAFEEMTSAGQAAIETRDRQQAQAGSGDDGTLDDQVAARREQLRLSPWTTDLEGQHSAALSLAQALFTRYLSQSDPADLAEAGELLHSTLAAVPDGSPVRVPIISTLGVIEVERFKLSGRGDDIEEALRLLRQAEAGDDSQRAKHQVNLAVALLEKNDVYGDDGALREAVARLDAAIASGMLPAETLLDAEHNLGTALIGRYQADGDPGDLDRAIEIAEQALRVLAQRPARAAGEYSMLCSALRLRYYRSSRVNDLSRAVTAMSEAVSKCPGGDSLAMYLSNLGSVLIDQYQVSGAETDLEKAIDAHDRAIDLTGDTASSYAERLNSLGVALSVAYRRSGQAADLAKVIETREQVVAAAAQAGRPPVPQHLDNLALSLRARYVLDGEGADLDEAVALSAQAVALSPATAARRGEYCDHLAGALADRWRSGRSADVARQAVRAYRESVTGSAEIAPATAETAPDTVGTAGRTGGSVGAARNWCRFAAERALWGEAAASMPAAQAAAAAEGTADPAPAELWAEAAEAAGVLGACAAAALREQLLATDEETTLATLQGAASEAAYVFARAGQLDLAVQTLEHGQSMMLAKTLTGKAAAAELARGGRADLADRYQALAGRLAALSRAAASPGWTPTILDETRLARALDTARADLDALISEIRAQPGFDGFLGGISFAEIRALAAESAIAYCAATVHGGLALLLAPGGPDVTPLFFDVSYDDLRTLLTGAGPDGGTSGFLAGVLGDSAALASALPAVLTVMRSAVGRPLAGALAARPGGECVIIPAGPMRLVPLHAALHGTDDEPCTPSAEITVSYAPSALSLRWAREKASVLAPAAGPGAHGFLGVADPTGRLRYAGLEVARAAKVLGAAGSSLVTGPAVRSGQVLTAMAGATYAHFACHGVYSPQDPGYSGLLLGGGDRLTVSDLRRSGALNARLVVASACQTAVADVARLPDEAIGLPTALLEAGAAGVIGTLWPVADLAAALLLSQYYDFLFPPPDRTSPTPAAALAAAQVWLANLTAGELGRYLEDLLTATAILPDEQAAALTDVMVRTRAGLALGYEETDRPFADPVFWAAFVLVGA